MLTIVLLNCRRQDNVEKLVIRYSAMAIVKEVLVWSTPPGDYCSDIPKVRTVSCYQEWGMFPRYALSLLASTEMVMAVDDDLFLSEESIKVLLSEWEKEPDIIHGIENGRCPDINQNYHVVEIPEGQSSERCEIVVGRAAVFHRKYAANTLTLLSEPWLQEMFQQAEKLGVHPTQVEDILLSYVAMRNSGRENIVHRVPFEELPGPHPICGRPNHFAYRRLGMNTIRQHLLTC